MGGGPAASHVFVVGGSTALGNSVGKAGSNGDSSAVGAVVHGSWPNEVVFASASVASGVRVDPSLEGEGGFVVSRVSLE